MIGGLVKTSLIDYPGKLCCVVFLTGCNFRCSFCHNRSLVYSETEPIDYHLLKEFLKKRKGQLEAVVITGGEPTLNKNLLEISKLAKSLNYSVKIDTNGSSPDVLSYLIKNELVDYIAMDIKTSLTEYKVLTRSRIEVNELIESIQLIINSKIQHEFRTTVISDFHSHIDFNQIGKLITGANKYVIQNYRFSTEQIIQERYRPMQPEQLLFIKKIMNSYVKKVIIKS